MVNFAQWSTISEIKGIPLYLIFFRNKGNSFIFEILFEPISELEGIPLYLIFSPFVLDSEVRGTTAPT